MKKLVMVFAAGLLFSSVAKAQVADDLCVATFADGKTFYAKVLSTSGKIVNTKMLHTGSLYSFKDDTVTASKGAYKVGHTCKKIVFYGTRKKDLGYVGDFIEVTFGDGVPFFATIESNMNDGVETRMLHSGNKYKFNADGVVLESTGVYPVGHKTQSILVLTRRK